MPGLVPLANVITDFRKSDGVMNAGGTLEFFENLTLTNKDIFNGYNSAVTLSNPLQLDAAGFEPGIWLGDGAYRIRCRATAPAFPTTLGAVIWTKDYVNPSSLASTVYTTANLTIDTTHSGKVIEFVNQITLTVTAAATLGNGFYCWFKNSGTTYGTIARANTANIIDLALADIKCEPDQMFFFSVNGNANGFITDRLKENSIDQVTRMRSFL